MLASGLAPSAGQTYRLDIAARSVQCAGQAPLVRVAHIALPAQRAVSVSGLLPVASVRYFFTPAQRALSLAGQAPASTATITIPAYPAQDVLALSGLAPSVTVSDNKVAQPPERAVSLSGAQPILGLDITATIPARAASFASAAPQIFVAQPSVREPAQRALVLSGKVPTLAIVDVSGWVTSHPGAGSYAATGYAPSLDFDTFLKPPVQGHRIRGQYPTLRIAHHRRIDVAQASAAFSGSAPAVSRSVKIAVGCGSFFFAGRDIGRSQTLGYWIGVSPGAALLASAGATLRYTGPYPTVGELVISRRLADLHKTSTPAAMHASRVESDLFFLPVANDLHKTVVRRAVVVSVEPASMMVNRNG
jgi:hypothetical protein